MNSDNTLASQSLWPLLGEQGGEIGKERGGAKGVGEPQDPLGWVAWASSEVEEHRRSLQKSYNAPASPLKALPQDCLCSHPKQQLLPVSIPNSLYELRAGGSRGEEGMGLLFSKHSESETSLVAQWLRIRLPVQGTWVRSLAREDPTCRGAAKPVSHNY